MEKCQQWNWKLTIDAIFMNEVTLHSFGHFIRFHDTNTHTHKKRIHLFSLTLNSFGDAIKNLNKWARFFLLSIWKKRTDVAVFFLVHSSKCRKIHVSKAGQRYVNSTLDIWPSFEATRWHNEGKLLGMNV